MTSSAPTGGPPTTSAVGVGVRRRATEWLSHPALEPGRLLRVGVPVIALLGVTGVLYDLKVPNTNPFDLDGEMRIPALWSFGLLAGGSVAALLASLAQASRAAAAFGGFLLFMAVDELIQIHETLEGATGVDWQLLYLPVVGVGGFFFLVLLRAMRRSAAALTLASGAGCWVIAQMLEMLQWHGDQRVSGYYLMATPEELLEMLGSLLFGLAILMWVRGTQPRTGD